MDSPARKSSPLWLLVPFLVYMLSLGLPALCVFPEDHPPHYGLGYQCLASIQFGMTHPPWWANPVFVTGLILLVNDSFTEAFWSGAVALLLALSQIYYCYDSILIWLEHTGTEPRNAFPLHIGYFVWLGSMVSLMWCASSESWSKAKLAPPSAP